MEQMIALWSMVMVHGLMVAGPGMVPNFKRCWGRGMDEPPGDFWTVNQMYSNSGG